MEGQLPVNDQISSAAEKRPPVLQHIQTISVGGLFVLACFYTLYVAREIFIPIVIAILLNFLLSPIIRFLKKLWIPRAISAAAVIIVFFSLIAVGFYQLSTPAVRWMNNANQNLTSLSEKVTVLIAPLREPLKGYFRIQEQLENTNTVMEEKGKQAVQIVDIKPPGKFNILIVNTGQFILQLSLVFFILYFLLNSDNFFLRKLIEILPHLEEKKETVTIFTQIEQKIYVFFVLKVLISIFLAIVIAITLFFIGMPNPILWGITAGVLEIFPYIGLTIGTILISLSAITIYDSLGQIILVLTLFFSICYFVGNFIAPWVLGRGFFIHPVIIFIGIILWAWLWGIAGALIAIPLLSILKIVFENIKSLQPLSKFLGE